jgi:hypothetical protein
MFVEGTLRWQVTEDCPWDLLMALAVRDLAGLHGVGDPVLPRLSPEPEPALHSAAGSTTGPPVAALRNPLSGSAATGSAAAGGADTDDGTLARQWTAWFDRAVHRDRRPLGGLLHPPHFEAFDRAIELQDLIIGHYDAAAHWAAERHGEYARTSLAKHAQRSADIVDVVHEREHELRRQAGYFRLDIDVLPLAESGAWIVGPHTVVVSGSLRDDSRAFREWFRPLVSALV